MGASSSFQAGDDHGNSEHSRVSDPNFRFLMGKVQNLGPAAQRLFNLGKLYLSPDDPVQLDKDKADFENLFPTVDESQSHYSQTASEKEMNKAFQLFRPLKKSKPIHHGQTYVQWKVSYDYQTAYLLCIHKRNIIYVQPIDDFPDFVKDFRFQRRLIRVGLFELIQGFAQIFFSGLDVMVLPGIQTESMGWDIASRYKTMHAKKLTHKLCSVAPEHQEKFAFSQRAMSFLILLFAKKL